MVDDTGGNYIPVKRTVKITKNGQQYLIRIPTNIVESMELKDGDRLALSTQKDPKEFVARVVNDDAKKK